MCFYTYSLISVLRKKNISKQKGTIVKSFKSIIFFCIDININDYKNTLVIRVPVVLQATLWKVLIEMLPCHVRIHTQRYIYRIHSKKEI